jgi:hypothetical protein
MRFALTIWNVRRVTTGTGRECPTCFAWHKESRFRSVGTEGMRLFTRQDQNNSTMKGVATIYRVKARKFRIFSLIDNPFVLWYQRRYKGALLIGGIVLSPTAPSPTGCRGGRIRFEMREVSTSRNEVIRPVALSMSSPCISSQGGFPCN